MTSQVDEIMRLAGVLATARVRRYAMLVGRAPLETEAGVDRKIDAATCELREAVEKLCRK